ncbi:MAG TPA: hypothetical protein VFN85_00020 [Solirubrobacterales bacterium]|nr:hypothetical protein [Solirubrobacterales bacterium]
MKMLSIAVACMFACAVASADATAAKSGQVLLKGKTRQGRAIRLTMNGNRLRLKRFAIALRCRSGGVLIDDESGFVPSHLGHGGRVRDHQVGSTDDVWLRGRLHGRVLRGAVRVHDRWGRAQCDSGWVRFHARARI